MEEKSPELRMTEAVQGALALRRIQKERLNSLLEAEFVTCDEKNKTMALRFPVHEWELNPAGHLHGGISAAMMDVTMGIFAHAFSGGFACITTSLSIQYLRPVCEGDWIRAEAIAEFTGRHVLNFTAKGILEKNGKTAFTAVASYMITDALLKDVVAEQEKEKNDR